MWNYQRVGGEHQFLPEHQVLFYNPMHPDLVEQHQEGHQEGPPKFEKK